MDDDIRHLDLLAIFHYIVAGILALFGLLPIIHLAVGIAMVTGSLDVNGNNANGPPPAFGFLVIGMALMMIAMCWAMATAIFVAGNRLKRHTGYTYCLVVAAIECMFTPFGTVLGIFTILVLSRPTVKALFGVQPPPPASS
jgi:hypothetical protein